MGFGVVQLDPDRFFIGAARSVAAVVFKRPSQPKPRLRKHGIEIGRLA